MAVTTRAPHFTSLIIAIGLAALTPADATTYVKFYNGSTGYTGTYNGAGPGTTVYETIKDLGLSTDCPTTGCGGPVADQLGDPMNFSGGNLPAGLTIRGTANGPDAGNANQVWDDLIPIFGGLGVGTADQFLHHSDEDQIAGADVLVLTFNKPVTLTGVGTLFADGHVPFSTDTSFDTVADVTAAAASIQFRLNGTDTNFLLANTGGLGLVGTIFTFEQKAGNPQFYVSALAFDVCEVCGNTDVPIPGALPLFASGLGALALLSWRRKRRTGLGSPAA
jgi:hypothetical protein